MATSFDPKSDITLRLSKFAKEHAGLRRLNGNPPESIRWMVSATPYFPSGHTDGLIVATDRQLAEWSQDLWGCIHAQVRGAVDTGNWNAQRGAFDHFIGQFFGLGIGSPAFLWTTFVKPPASFGLRQSGITPTYGPRSCSRLLPWRRKYALPAGLGRPDLEILVRRRRRDSGVLLDYSGQLSRLAARPIIHDRAKSGRDRRGRELFYGQHWELDLATQDDAIGLSETGNSTLGVDFLRSEPLTHQNYLSVTFGLVVGEHRNSTVYILTWTLHPQGAMTFGINCQFGLLQTFLIQYPSLALLLAEYLGIDPHSMTVGWYV